MILSKIKELLIGKALDPLRADTRKHLAMATFLAWVGLGADGLSSSAYGPAETFHALGMHTELAVFIAIATAVSIFIIALSYNQVIELFPSGGGGYRVATELLGPKLGLLSGVALILDYMLTTAISVASGMDAIFSFLPPEWSKFKIFGSLVMVGLLVLLNLRGMKNAVKVLMPIFLGFVVMHVLLIVYGLAAHAELLPTLIPTAVSHAENMASAEGWLPVIAFLLIAYSQGGGTYTGLEAVSNDINVLAEPRVQTGKRTMFCIALSLAFTAGGIILLYALWDAHHVEGKTLNAVVFGSIISNLNWPEWLGGAILGFILMLQAGLLFVAGNTGLMCGPHLMANMATDSWIPHQFRYLSSRLVTKNGIFLMGIFSVIILLWTEGSVSLLVVLYSLCVFMTFSLSLLGLCVFWAQHIKQRKAWWRLLLSFTGFILCFTIFCLLLYSKFTSGGWVALLAITTIAGLCFLVKSHYQQSKKLISQMDLVYSRSPFGQATSVPQVEDTEPTAVFIVGSSKGGGIYALEWARKHFPNHFKKFVFVNVRTVDLHSYHADAVVEKLKQSAQGGLDFLVQYCHSHGLAAESRLLFGTDAVAVFADECAKIAVKHPNSIFFTSKLIFEHDNVLTRLLHNQAAFAIQRKLHFSGLSMVILPMKV
jgi:amino acid transporter